LADLAVVPVRGLVERQDFQGRQHGLQLGAQASMGSSVASTASSLGGGTGSMIKRSPSLRIRTSRAPVVRRPLHQPVGPGQDPRDADGLRLGPARSLRQQFVFE
jgi:hypothetical protein